MPTTSPRVSCSLPSTSPPITSARDISGVEELLELPDELEDDELDELPDDEDDELDEPSDDEDDELDEPPPTRLS